MLNEHQAADFIHRYGNVGRTAEDLLENLPSESELAGAETECLRRLQAAFRLMRNYHKLQPAQYVYVKEYVKTTEQPIQAAQPKPE